MPTIEHEDLVFLDERLNIVEDKGAPGEVPKQGHHARAKGVDVPVPECERVFVDLERCPGKAAPRVLESGPQGAVGQLGEHCVLERALGKGEGAFAGCLQPEEPARALDSEPVRLEGLSC